MEEWAQDVIDEEAPAHLTIWANGLGRLHFIYVHVFLDCRFVLQDGVPRVEFSFVGRDDGGGDDVSGRGYAKIEEGGLLKGRIFLHQGDDSGFAARRPTMTEANIIDRPWKSGGSCGRTKRRAR